MSRHVRPLLAGLAVGVLLVCAPAALTAAEEPTSSPDATPSVSATAALWLPHTDPDGSDHATGATDIAVDAEGGLQLTYVEGPGADGRYGAAWYVACPAACEAPLNWTRTQLGDRVIEARLQLDPNGHPRVLLVIDTATDTLVSKPQRSYRYASCDRGCSSESHWDETTIATAVGTDDASPAASNRFFALDDLGHPALIYRDTPIGPEDAGTFYVSCLVPRPADCHSPAAWTKVALATGFPLTAPELMFTTSGEPRFLGQYIDAAQGIDRLVYGECDPHCTVGGSTQLFGAGAGASYSLALDHDGRPRIVFDTGASSGGDALDAHRLYYLWCDASCTSPASWQDAEVPVLPGTDPGVSLVMDSHDHPRFAYQRADGDPGLGWCDRDCESALADWSGGLIEATDVLQRVDPLRSSVDCSVSAWRSGARPSLALDGHDRPTVSFDTVHSLGGADLRSGHDGEACPLSGDISMARVALLPDPDVTP